MGFDVTLTGSTTTRDGGIDLIAIPKVRSVGSFLLAGQIKHHRGRQKTGRDAVDRLLAWKDTCFRLGLLITNTFFTRDAIWTSNEEAHRAFIRLRDFNDLKRWLEDYFHSQEDWQEIPQEVTLAPGVTIAIPKPKLDIFRDSWAVPNSLVERE
jgi:Restriction endonuclease